MEKSVSELAFLILIYLLGISIVAAIGYLGCDCFCLTTKSVDEEKKKMAAIYLRTYGTNGDELNSEIV